MVGFSEQKDIFGLLSVSPISSGLCIGSSNWIISSGFEKVAYVSGSSTLTTHPRLIDTTTPKNVDCLILTSLTQTPTLNPG
jgi:integrator complex subunit 9